MLVWPVELLHMLALQQEKERISGGLSPAGLFSQSVPEHEIEACELVLGVKLDPEHRRFLQHANGWDGFSASADLFSTADLLGSPRFKTAQEWIKLMDRRVLGPYAKKRSALFPIGKSAASTDLLLMLNEGSQIQPKVLWFTNELVEEFESFEQMFSSFKTYMHSAIDYWIKRAAKQSP